MHICEQLANKYCISRLHSLEQKESNSSLLFENDLVSFKSVFESMACNKDSVEETIPIADPNELTIVTFDDVLKKVGEFGRFQVVLYIMFSLP